MSPKKAKTRSRPSSANNLAESLAQNPAYKGLTKKTKGVTESKKKTKKMEKEDPLLQFRRQLDDLDQELLKILKLRFKTLKKIQKWKTQKNIPFRDTQREYQILQKIKKALRGSEAQPQILHIFKKLLECSLWVPSSKLQGRSQKVKNQEENNFSKPLISRAQKT